MIDGRFDPEMTRLLASRASDPAGPARPVGWFQAAQARLIRIWRPA